MPIALQQQMIEPRQGGGEWAGREKSLAKQQQQTELFHEYMYDPSSFGDLTDTGGRGGWGLELEYLARCRKTFVNYFFF